VATKREKSAKKPKQQQGHSDEDLYRKLDDIEKKVDSGKQAQIRIALDAVGIAFVILGLSLWSDFLQFIGIDTTQGSINPIFYIILGAITIIFANIVTRLKQEVERRQAAELTEK
jgi:hypothetical protein